MHTVMVIAGYDPSSSAGVLRDIKTLQKLNVYGVGIITALTFQSPTGVHGLKILSPEDIQRQFEALIEELEIEYAKVGMVGSRENAALVAKLLEKYEIKAVVDPVLSSTSGAKLIDSPSSLIPLLRVAEVITPNVIEAEILSGTKIRTRNELVRAGKKLEDAYGCTIIKGGHLEGEDFLFCEDMHSVRLDKIGHDARGTGCAYSSALTAFLTRGYGLREAFVNARMFIQKEIENAVECSGKYVLP